MTLIGLLRRRLVNFGFGASCITENEGLPNVVVDKSMKKFTVSVKNSARREDGKGAQDEVVGNSTLSTVESVSEHPCFRICARDQAMSGFAKEQLCSCIHGHTEEQILKVHWGTMTRYLVNEIQHVLFKNGQVASLITSETRS